MYKRYNIAINSFERKILRHILGPVKENDVWRVRYNNELYELYKEPSISIIVKLKRLQWAGHVQRMGNECIPKKILYATIGGKRHVGRPRNRWIDAMEEDAKKILGVRNWKKKTLNRDIWRGFIQEAKV